MGLLIQRAATNDANEKEGLTRTEANVNPDSLFARFAADRFFSNSTDYRSGWGSSGAVGRCPRASGGWG